MLFVLGCQFNVQLKKPAPSKINSERKNLEEHIKKDDKTSQLQQKENLPFDYVPNSLIKSQTPQAPIINKAPYLPWNRNPVFLQALIDNNNPKLISKFSITLPEPFMSERTNIALAANKLKGAVVMPGQIFSLNKRIGKRTVTLGFKMGPMIKHKKKSKSIGGGVCKIATVMYNVTVLANQKIVERHPHSRKSPYIRTGQDATLSYGSKDFRFQNVTSSPILIWAQSLGDTLYVAMYGDYTPPQITWKHQATKKAGIRKVHSWVLIKNGNKKIIKDMGISKYYLKK